MEASVRGSGRAVVLGAGGLAGIAWETGVVLSLVEAGIDLPAADLVVGTSAGASVGPHLFDRSVLARFYDAQLVPPAGGSGGSPSSDGLAEEFGRFLARDPSPMALRREVGRLALERFEVTAARRHEVITRRLLVGTWPSDRLRVVAVDARSGQESVFDRASGVGLIDAVAASSAVPGVFEPTPIGGRRYTDGGTRSMSNADLASGCSTVLVVAPFPDVVELRTPEIGDRLAEMARHSTVLTVSPDEASVAAFGTDVLDPAVQAPSARAGRSQGEAEAGRVRALWEDPPRIIG